MNEATSRKVAVSITDVVNGIFHLHNPSGRIMALEMTQPLRGMSEVKVKVHPRTGHEAQMGSRGIAVLFL